MFLTFVVLILGVFVIRNINTQRTDRLSEIEDSSLKATAYMAGLNREEFDKSNLENTDVVKIDDGVVQGYKFKPKNQKSNDVFITLGGSEGDIDYLHSSFLSENGYNTYAFYYFGAKNQNPELVDVELRDFEAMLSYIKKENKEVGNITLIGTSKGAEMALLLAHYYPDTIDKLVLYSPTSYIWQGLSKDYQNVGSS